MTPLFLENNKDFVICKDDGQSVFSLMGQSQRIIPDSNSGELFKLHTLDSFDYLKLEESNYIEIDEVLSEKRQIKVIYDYIPKSY